MAAEIMSQNPFAYTATGELGENRDTMLSNELLLRTQLGRPKRRGYSSAPPDHFVYGRPLEPRLGGADDALHGWPPMRPNMATTTLPFSRKEKKTDRDFMVLNKAAVQAGLVTSSENYKFRATHDVRRKTAGDENTRSRTRRIPPTMVFGISTRPSTPIFDLLEHKYQDKWLMSRRQMELTKRQEESKRKEHFKMLKLKQRRNPNTVYETRASLLRTYQNPVDEAPLWQLPKFKKNAKPSLQTFRSDPARVSGYEHFESDQISRKGKLGHGVYESAKN
ncbi:cilia- and flagella-associated protein 77-like isoform X3 [Mizuhopecten yessoensis]|uniref:cilia- and flagella-associated protein 77-like isoform X3 n=1 Tax=Mizuhopecten yessoensis TaxID=6573 RepID=UPI000B458302|nr:cilia- and flagella-associated protein 77-like isoform X3 [Mizuhopecten yessoensis]